LKSDCKIYTNIIKNKFYTYYKNKVGERNGFVTHTIKTEVF